MKEKLYDKFFKETRNNYILYYSLLVANNINSLYKIFKNNHDYKYRYLLNEIQGEFILNEHERKLVDDLIEKTLKDNFNLVFIDKENVQLQKIK